MGLFDIIGDIVSFPYFIAESQMEFVHDMMGHLWGDPDAARSFYIWFHNDTPFRLKLDDSKDVEGIWETNS
jgi:hypothetical protein